MEDKLVSTYFIILDMVYKRKMGVNEIHKIITGPDPKEVYKETGLCYKLKLTNAIKELEKDKIIKKEKDPKHKQREYISITDLGLELLEINKRLNDYTTSYKNLYEQEKKLKNIYKLQYQTQIRNNKLRLMGWNDEEIFWFEDTLEGIKEITALADFDIYEIFIYRYRLILSKFKLGKVSKMIINSLLMEVTTFKIENLYDSYKNSNETEIEDYEEFIDDQLEHISQSIHIFPKLFKDEIKSHLLARLCLLGPTTDLISDELEKEKKSMESYKNYSSEQAKKEDKLTPLHFKCLIDAYKEYINLKTN